MRDDRTYTNTGPNSNCDTAMTWAQEENRRRGRPKSTWRRTVEKERKKQDRDHGTKWGPYQLTEKSGKTLWGSNVPRVTKTTGEVPQVDLWEEFTFTKAVRRVEEAFNVARRRASDKIVTSTLGPTHHQKLSRAAQNVIRVKLKMAENVFAGLNPPSRGIYRFLQRNVQDCLSQTDNPAIMSSISKYFNEVEAAVGLLEEKYRDQSRNREVQQLVGTQSMVINTLKKIQEKIVRGLRTTPSMAIPWKGEFTLDLPRRYLWLF